MPIKIAARLDFESSIGPTPLGGPSLSNNASVLPFVTRSGRRSAELIRRLVRGMDQVPLMEDFSQLPHIDRAPHAAAARHLGQAVAAYNRPTV
jgi:hypothetical protein